MATIIEPSGEQLASALKTIPGDSGTFIVGDTLKLIHEPIKYLREHYHKYGEIFWCQAYGMKIVYLMGPDANQFVLQNKDNVFSNYYGWFYFIGKFFDRGLMLLDFEEHSWHRKIMQQVFHKPLLQEYIKSMNLSLHRAIKQWQPDDHFMVLPTMKQLILDLAADVFMAQKSDFRILKINQAFIDVVRAGTAVVRFSVPGLRWSKGLKGRRILENYFFSRVADKRHSQTNDMFSVLCHAKNDKGEKLNDQDVVNHMIFLMMAAHDTTTITLSIMFYYLAKYPKWQQYIRKESLALGKEVLAYEDMEKLVNISLCMKECLRLCPPVPGLPRRTVKDTEYKGYFIPKGTMTMTSLAFTGLMGEYWPNPEVFDPERFSATRREDNVHPYAWVPFGGGAHKCIGLHFAEMQVKAVLHQIVQKFQWSVDADYEMPMDRVALPVPRDGLPVKMESIAGT
jgi:cytochrome P450